MMGLIAATWLSGDVKAPRCGGCIYGLVVKIKSRSWQILGDTDLHGSDPMMLMDANFRSWR